MKGTRKLVIIGFALIIYANVFEKELAIVIGALGLLTVICGCLQKG